MRLQKFLADAGIASRRKCEELIKEGKVTVNGSVAELGCSVSEDDCVVYDGKQVHPAAKKVVYAFYKPKKRDLHVLRKRGQDQGRRLF